MKDEIKFTVSPKFNLLYELVMPLGRKIRRDIFASLVFFIISLIGKYALKSEEIKFLEFNISDILFWICIFFAVIFLLKFLIDVILKIMQYNRIFYTFYEDKLIYEDTFLNQQRKIIKYENIKEIEIRRKVLDRIMGYGIIIISTNAEGNFNTGLVVYGIKNPKEIYEKIEDLVHNKVDVEAQKTSEEIQIENEIKIESEVKKDLTQQVKEEIEREEDFKNSLKN